MRVKLHISVPTQPEFDDGEHKSYHQRLNDRMAVEIAQILLILGSRINIQ